jgi:hypothetical protein
LIAAFGPTAAPLTHDAFPLRDDDVGWCLS